MLFRSEDVRNALEFVWLEQAHEAIAAALNDPKVTAAPEPSRPVSTNHDSAHAEDRIAAVAQWK